MKKTALIHIAIAIFAFLLFASDIESDRDFYTWIYLLCAIMNFLAATVLVIRADIESLKKP